jgi:hypothetical protein
MTSTITQCCPRSRARGFRQAGGACKRSRCARTHDALGTTKLQHDHSRLGARSVHFQVAGKILLWGTADV